MEVVINTTYSGFELSQDAIELCIIRGMSVQDLEEGGTAHFTRNINGYQWPRDYFDKEFRTHPVLVGVVRELNPPGLKVISIPFETTEGWHITEENGEETIEENHRTWR